MAKLFEVYRCPICGNMVEVVGEGGGKLVCCGSPMEKLEANTVDASHEKHVPVFCQFYIIIFLILFFILTLLLTNKPVFVRYTELKYLRKKRPDDMIVLKKRCPLPMFAGIPANREA